MPSAILEVQFHGYQLRLAKVATYVSAVMPCLTKEPAALPLFVEGSIVLAVAIHEDFLGTLVGAAAQHKERALRRHLAKSGTADHQARVRACDVPTLVRMARRRLSFEKRGAGIKGMYDALFGCSPWPSEEVADVVLDLVLVRNMIVHSGSAEVGIGSAGQYAAQLRRPDVLTVTAYGDLRTYWVDHSKALALYLDAMKAFNAQFQHLRKHLVESESWLDSA